VRIGTFTTKANPHRSFPGVIEGDLVRTPDVATVVDFLAAGLSTGEGRPVALDALEVLAPIPKPPSIRDFFVFEQHVATARGRRGLGVPDFWYREPVFYFTNPSAVIGPKRSVPYPVGRPNSTTSSRSQP
jgi:2-keto-4-pentenoate hydratase/2-oxohepta-3-ene-1,7-dioic acid hydratase in catechol pathway